MTGVEDEARSRRCPIAIAPRAAGVLGSGKVADCPVGRKPSGGERPALGLVARGVNVLIQGNACAALHVGGTVWLAPGPVFPELTQRPRCDQDRPSPVARRRISRNTPPLWAAWILRSASSQNSASISAPTKNRPNSLAATPVVPEPQNGSRTRSPSPLEASRARLRSFRGFWVGW
jgi:hypothetical protein